MSSTRLILRILLAAMVLVGCVPVTGVPGIKHVFTPSGDGRHPGVIVLPTRVGIKPHVVDFAGKLSRRGYVTVVVDFIKTKGGTDNIDAAYDFLSTHPAVLPDRIGAVGFSKGANNAVGFSYYSHNFTKRRVQVVVGYYTGPDAGINDELHPAILFLHGDQDIRTSPGHVQQFCKLQREMGTLCEVHIFEGVTHAFDHSSSWGIYNRKATADAFERAVSFLDKHLKGATAK